MKYLSALVLLFAFLASAQAEDYIYEGPWKTTNRKLDGIQTAVVKSVGIEKWEARFYGIWQGVDYDYNVKFTGKPDALRGTATIDGAFYEWKGNVDQEKFEGTFTGDRYTGFFDMTRKKSVKK
jgi:hypothetical protein